MENNLYSKKVMEHFKKPHNYGRIENADGIGEIGNVVCGDLMKLYIKIGKNKKGEEIVGDIKFETFGCVAAISSSSAVTDLVKGKTIKEALEINSRKIAETLGGLPPIKYHCSVLGADAFLEAIYDYFSKNKRPIPKKIQKNHLRLKKEKKELEERYKQWR
ncbi:MAG: iron-sulfur cluster assembly scaffold protein [Candidatus Nealsonbacteria bacterium RIFCSPHIGHO2_01_FULL_38_55]|uniref:Iron-sulfur cluster assembly scaffold protein n=2 Tax=Candidatus Nealsoniibacteriota TaxID=1817911 RepID=A0A1G2EJC0_9BACT|nr:MAG: hypothetical protein US88_C0008G0049 [Parcubacteria group bacterium GW2011_GWA2_38_27]KKQ96971.1 MAG: hypothetical protein UT22_C0020G0012 [Parcubacteria group bacterium GW2011_GWC2_39_11]OGZ20043.1 MAG: iron-sulfur cluster assembly scaffold protein [Candidatus Nealsonbacteria bacterium RIFCSPHIGHO2_01_FULL_38_55]OGZ21603.1 MAG: iron-sulfur cluster assembly scaffold protein [Candidatus Nealsonbacteria bacterium RIFCSPHIGHO2_02_38_10]OGZ22971.1 MAG: iron-sulfur cluster assembly scaffold 